jgi:hypothetical protein
MLAIGALAAQGDRLMRKGGKAAKWAARSERLSAALRENLKRRKAQARGRAGALADGGGDAAGTPDEADSAGQEQPGTPDFRRNRSNE